MNIKYECLRNTDIKEIYDTFIDAFSDYQVKLDVSFEKFQNMMNRRSVDFAFSMGAFDNKKLIGFILNGKRMINDMLVAYDSGTGIRQKYQGEKLGKKLLDANLKYLRSNSFDKYILEVITSNEKAFKLYKSFGFGITRTFNCFKNLTMAINNGAETKNIIVEEVGIQAINRAELNEYFDFSPSWQNSLKAIKEDLLNFTMFQAVVKERVVGYGVIEPKTGDIPFLSVNKKYRRQLVGTAILSKLKDEATSSSLSVLNIPTDYNSVCSFLEKHNFKNFIQQYEMEYDFR